MNVSDYCISAISKKILAKKEKDLRLYWPPIVLSNKYVYLTKSQFLFVSEMLKMKVSLKFGKIIQNCLKNSAVSF